VQRGWEVELVYGMAQNTVRVGERSVSREQNVRSAVGESVRLVSILILEGWLPGVQPPRDGPSFGSAACALEVLWSCGYSDCDACLCHVTSPPPVSVIFVLKSTPSDADVTIAAFPRFASPKIHFPHLFIFFPVFI